jgi:WD40 repeat protein
MYNGMERAAGNKIQMWRRARKPVLKGTRPRPRLTAAASRATVPWPNTQIKRQAHERLQDRAHGGAVRAIRFSREGRRAVTCGWDGAWRLWDTESWQPVVTAAAGQMRGQDEWLLWTPDGYFTGSRNGGELVCMVLGLRVFGLDQRSFFP